MIDVSNLWKSDSLVENLKTVTDWFYNTMCNAPEMSLDEMRNMDTKKYFAFHCAKCGADHAGKKAIWSAIVPVLNHHTPEKDSPEFQEYVIRRKGFFKQVQFFDVRDYAEPFLKASSEGEVITAAIHEHQRIMAEFSQLICNSTATYKDIHVSHIVVFECSEHGTHNIPAPVNKMYRSLINGAKVPYKFANKLSKVSQRIILRETSASYREFNETNPYKKIENPCEEGRLETIAKKKADSRAAEVAKQARKKSAAKTHQRRKAELEWVNPALYILPPHLMSAEWLIEYQVCGRKTRFTYKAALAHKARYNQDDYNIYQCSYCSSWHYGHMTNGTSTNTLMKRGLKWYRSNPKKANIFIHRIMMEG